MKSNNFLNRILDGGFNEGDLDQWQKEFVFTFKSSISFRKMLEGKQLTEIPHFIDYLRLVRSELINLNKEDDSNLVMERFFIAFLEKQEAINREAKLIRDCFEEENKWTAILNPASGCSVTTAKDLLNIDKYCKKIAQTNEDANAILLAFMTSIVKYRKVFQQPFSEIERTLFEIQNNYTENWYSEPWYYLYVQYFGTVAEQDGTFERLTNMLDYLEELGIFNVYILPFYESSFGDAGYDVSDYSPAKLFGGQEHYNRFLNIAVKRGFRIITDLIFNHTSTEHQWFKKALDGESRYFNYYLKCPANWKTIDVKGIKKEIDGEVFLYLPEQNEYDHQVISQRKLFFPEIEDTVWINKPIATLGKEVTFYRSFYPFQVDLNLQAPEVLNELFELLGNELSSGIVGKRLNAMAYYIKKPGTNGVDLPETVALQKLIKLFVKHINAKAIIIPEVVTASKKLKGYAGVPTYINGQITTSRGDALLDFQLQGMLREMIYFKKTEPFWSQVYERGEEGGNTAVQLLPIEHHDETYLGFIQELGSMREYIESTYEYFDDKGEKKHTQRGILFGNELSAGGRYADCLNREPNRIAMAFFSLYMMPATPVIYYGTEIGATNNWEHMERRQKQQYETYLKLLGEDLVGEGQSINYEQCKDPRELHRGPIPAIAFYEALENRYPALEIIKVLNQLRKEKTALNSYYFSNVDTWNAAILGLIRYPPFPDEEQRPILVLINLSGEQLETKIPSGQLQQKLARYHFSFNQMLKVDFTKPIEEAIDRETKLVELTFDYLSFEMNAYSALLLEVD